VWPAGRSARAAPRPAPHLIDLLDAAHELRGRHDDRRKPPTDAGEPCPTTRAKGPRARWCAADRRCGRRAARAAGQGGPNRFSAIGLRNRRWRSALHPGEPLAAVSSSGTPSNGNGRAVRRRRPQPRQGQAGRSGNGLSSDRPPARARGVGRLPRRLASAIALPRSVALHQASYSLRPVMSFDCLCAYEPPPHDMSRV